MKSQPKQVDPQDPELRQLPTEGLTANAIREKLNYKVFLLNAYAFSQGTSLHYVRIHFEGPSCNPSGFRVQDSAGRY